MTVEHFNDSYRRLFKQVDKKVDNKKWIRFGIVDSVRKKDKKVRVVLMPEGIKTGWMRIYFFNSFGSGQLPQKNDEVICIFESGNPDAGIVLCGSFSNNPTEPDGDADINFIDKYGNKILMQDGKVIIESDSIELGDGASKAVILETYHDALLNHTHIDPLSGNTGTVTPGTLLIAGHKTNVTKAK